MDKPEVVRTINVVRRVLVSLAAVLAALVAVTAASGFVAPWAAIVIGFVAGLTAPKGRRMGHAGAIISATGDSAAEKAEIMRSYGLTVAPDPGSFGDTVAEVMRRAA